jgi:hypothetical protein
LLSSITYLSTDDVVMLGEACFNARSLMAVQAGRDTKKTPPRFLACICGVEYY